MNWVKVKLSNKVLENCRGTILKSTVFPIDSFTPAGRFLVETKAESSGDDFRCWGFFSDGEDLTLMTMLFW